MIAGQRLWLSQVSGPVSLSDQDGAPAMPTTMVE